MFDVNGYIGQVEKTLGINIPPNATEDVVYNLVYDALAEKMGIPNELKIKMDFASMKPEAGEMLQGEEQRDGFDCLDICIAVDRNSKLYRNIKAVSYGSNAENVYGAFAKYTRNIMNCTSDAKTILSVLMEGVIIIAGAGAIGAGIAATIIAIVSTGGAAAALTPALISSICAGVAFVASVLSRFNERSFTGIVLNDSNKDAELNYNVGDVYCDSGKFVILPGEAESRRAYIPKIQENHAHVGLYKIHNKNWFEGAGGVLRFKFANSSPEYIDLMMLSPYARGNVTGITSGGTMYHVSKQFSWMRDADKNTMEMDINGVKGRATIVNMRGSDAQGVAWFEFNK